MERVEVTETDSADLNEDHQELVLPLKHINKSRLVSDKGYDPLKHGPRRSVSEKRKPSVRYQSNVNMLIIKDGIEELKD